MIVASSTSPPAVTSTNRLTRSAATDAPEPGRAKTPPTISASSVNITGAAVTDRMDNERTSDSQVDYGTTTTYGHRTPLDTTLVTSHSVSLSNLVRYALPLPRSEQRLLRQPSDLGRLHLHSRAASLWVVGDLMITGQIGANSSTAFQSQARFRLAISPA